jgi:UDP:flavonoid glycosyltransferase YjiC (YdhE family)
LGGLAVYVTSHGYGHLNRVVAVLNCLPESIPVVIRSHRDLHNGWQERLTRPAVLEHAVWDAGAVNPPGDSNATDGPATIARAVAFHGESWPRIDAEADRLRRQATRAVLCDAPAAPLLAAARAGVPGFALANFTWAEIYAEHVDPADRAARAMLADLRAASATATAFRAQPALPLDEFRERIDVGLVVSAGRDRRGELRQRLGIGRSERIVYLYVGRYGQDDLDWRRLAGYRGVHFVGFHPPPSSVGSVANLHVVDPAEWTGATLLASADAALTKAGYGAVSEAMAARTPLIYPPRAGFAEHRALEEGLRLWGGGIPITSEQFARLDLAAALDRAFSQRPAEPPYPTDGAARIARHLATTIR